jgi:hypothetical protein
VLQQALWGGKHGQQASTDTVQCEGQSMARAPVYSTYIQYIYSTVRTVLKRWLRGGQHGLQAVTSRLVVLVQGQSAVYASLGSAGSLAAGLFVVEQT